MPSSNVKLCSPSRSGWTVWLKDVDLSYKLKWWRFKQLMILKLWSLGFIFMLSLLQQSEDIYFIWAWNIIFLPVTVSHGPVWREGWQELYRLRDFDGGLVSNSFTQLFNSKGNLSASKWKRGMLQAPFPPAVTAIITRRGFGKNSWVMKAKGDLASLICSLLLEEKVCAQPL